jgi:hypothetical protein
MNNWDYCRSMYNDEIYEMYYRIMIDYRKNKLKKIIELI